MITLNTPPPRPLALPLALPLTTPHYPSLFLITPHYPSLPLITPHLFTEPRDSALSGWPLQSERTPEESIIFVTIAYEIINT